MRTLFSGKRNVEISEYTAGKSVKVTIDGLERPLFMSINRIFDGQKLSTNRVEKRISKSDKDAIFAAIADLTKAIKGLKK